MKKAKTPKEQAVVLVESDTELNKIIFALFDEQPPAVYGRNITDIEVFVKGRNKFESFITTYSVEGIEAYQVAEFLFRAIESYRLTLSVTSGKKSRVKN